MSKLQCPVCGQEASGRKAAKRVRKWLDDSRLDHFMYDKLLQLVKAKMYGGEQPMKDQWAALDREAAEEQLLKAAEDLPVEKRTDEQGRPLPRKMLREQHHRRMDTLRQGNPLGWHAMFGTTGGELLQPVETSPEVREHLRRQRKRESNRRWLERHPNYSKDYYARKKAELQAARPELQAARPEPIETRGVREADKPNERRKQRAAAKANGGRNDEA